MQCTHSCNTLTTIITSYPNGSGPALIYGALTCPHHVNEGHKSFTKSFFETNFKDFALNLHRATWKLNK